MCVTYYMSKYRKIPVKAVARKSYTVRTRRYKKKPMVPHKPKHLRTGKAYVPKISSGLKSGGTSQCGTGHWKSYGKGPKGSFKMKGFIGKMSKLLPPQIQLTDDKSQISCLSAVQKYAIVGNLYSPYDIYNYNGGQLIAATNLGTNKVLLKDYSLIVAFTNQTNANVKVTLYDIIQRRDKLSGSTNDAPDAAWLYETTLSTNYLSTNTAAVPFDSAVFTQNYKVISSKDYRLAQGETGEHFVNGKMNRVWDHSNDYSTTPGSILRYRGGYKGLTYWCLAVVQGFPTDNDNATVTTSIAEVDFVTTTRYSYRQVSTQNHVATSATNLAAAAGHAMNQGSGADTAISNA